MSLEYYFIEDLPLVLDRLGGNRSLLDRLLKKFSVNYRSARVDYTSLEGSGNTEECRRFVHSLKGVSANLGMDGLYRICVPLEAVLRDCGLQGTGAAVESFLSEIEAIVAEIDRLLA